MVRLKKVARARRDEFTSVDIRGKFRVGITPHDEEEWELPDDELSKILKSKTEQELCEEIRDILKSIKDGTAEYDDTPL